MRVQVPCSPLPEPVKTGKAVASSSVCTGGFEVPDQWGSDSDEDITDENDDSNNANATSEFCVNANQGKYIWLKPHYFAVYYRAIYYS